MSPTRLMLFLILWLTILLAAACGPTLEPTPTAETGEGISVTAVLATAAAPTPTPPTETPTVAPTSTAAEAEPTASPTAAEPQATGEELPVSDELNLTVLDQFGGVAQGLKVVDSLAYVGFGPRLLVLEVSDPANPRLLGQSEPLPGLVLDVDVADGIAYVVGGPAGLITLEVSDPADIQVLSAGQAPAGVDWPGAYAITLVDGIAHLVSRDRQTGSTTLTRYDAADPGQLELLSEHSFNPNDNILITPKLIIVTGNQQLQLRETADPEALVGRATLASGSYASFAAVHDQTVTVAEAGQGSGLEQFDLSDPTQPASLGELIPLEVFFINRAVTDGDLFLVAGTFGEFGFCNSQIHIIDLTGEQPEQASQFDPANCLGQLALQDDILFITGRSGLQTYDLSDPAQPVLLGQFTHPDGFHDAQAATANAGYGYIFSGEGDGFELNTIDLAQAEAPDLGQQLPLGSNNLLGLHVRGNTLVAPVWLNGLTSLDISDPAAPQLLYQPVEGELVSGDFNVLAFKDDVVYMPVVSDQLIGAVGAIDLSDPANPQLANVVETQNGMIMHQVAASDRLYVLSQGESNQVHIYDLSQPLEPQLISQIRMAEPVSRLAVVGDRLYASCDQWNCAHLTAYDVSDPANPTLADLWDLPFGIQDMVSDEQGLIYLTVLEDGLWVLDAADPEAVRLVGHLPLPVDFFRPAVIGDQVYISAYDAGLYQVQVGR